MKRIVLTGGPGSGKSTVIDVLVQKGFDAAEDSARAIIRERKSNGHSPRPEPEQFGREILARDIAAYQSVRTSPTFFERSIADALNGLHGHGYITQDVAVKLMTQFKYHPKVFLFLPWREIYQKDSERDQNFNEAVSVYRPTREWYIKFGYEIIEMPFSDAVNRAEFVLTEIGLTQAQM